MDVDELMLTLTVCGSGLQGRLPLMGGTSLNIFRKGDRMVVSVVRSGSDVVEGPKAGEVRLSTTTSVLRILANDRRHEQANSPFPPKALGSPIILAQIRPEYCMIDYRHGGNTPGIQMYKGE